MKTAGSNKKSLWISIVLQLATFGILYLVVAWREPNPPIQQYGIELSLQSISSASDQTAESSSTSSETVQPPEPLESEVQKDIENDPPENEISEAENVETEEEIEQVEEMSDELITEESSVAQPEQSKEIEQPSLVKEEQKLEEPKEMDNDRKEILLEEVTLLDSVSSESTSLETVSEQSIDSRALYISNTEATNEVELTMAGFQLYQISKPEDKSDETGKIVFEIIVDEDGYVIGVKQLESTILSPTVVQAYREAIEQMQLEKTTSNSPPKSTGTITFIIQSN
ncbi:MAG: protein TonB [Cyclobacteriaceae bacterium]